jgi:DNA-binding CsgD family transcriptional regulator/tetratricopeptide (TPR) repeat protein
VSDAVVVAALVVTGRVASAQGDYAEAVALGREALDLAQVAGLTTTDALYLLGTVSFNTDDPATRNDAAALAHFEGMLAAYPADEEPVRRAWTLVRIAGLVLRSPSPDLARVRRHYQESLSLSRAVGHTPGTAEALCGLGEVARRTSDLATAAASFREAMALYAELGHLWGIARVFESLAALAIEIGPVERAASLFGTAARLRDELALPVSASGRRDHDAAIASVRATLGPEHFDAVWAEARSRDVNDAIADAEAWVAGLKGAPSTATPPRAADAIGLSPREREVLHLLATGMSDREIAESLAISYRTVTNHVGSILAKLDVPTRTAAAALAVRRGLV